MNSFLQTLNNLYAPVIPQTVLVTSDTPNDLEEKAIQSQFEATWVAGRARYPEVNVSILAKEGYAGNVIAYACISFIARSAAEVPFKVLSDTGQKITDHPALRLLHKPNSYMDYGDFISATMILLNVAGNCYWELERSKVGKIVGLWPMLPERVSIIPGIDGNISGYAYTYAQRTVVIPAKDVLHFKYFHPQKLDEGLSPMAVAARWIDVNTSAADSIRAFFDNRAVPAAILIVKKKLLQAEADRVKAEWRSRFTRNYHDVAVVDQDMEFKPVGATNQDAQLDQINLESQSQICAAFNVPPILVGLRVGLENSPWANVNFARRIFWEDTLIPQLNMLGRKMSLIFATGFGEGWTLVPDIQNVIALREDRTAMHTAARDGVIAGYLTINDARALVNLPPVPGGDVFLWRFDSQRVTVAQLEAGFEPASLPPSVSDMAVNKHLTGLLLDRF